MSRVQEPFRIDQRVQRTGWLVKKVFPFGRVNIPDLIVVGNPCIDMSDPDAFTGYLELVA